MDIYIRGIKTFCCLAPKQHTKHKTTRVLCRKYTTLCGLLNAHNVAVDFTNCRGIGRRFLFLSYSSIYYLGCRPPMHLFVWQCYIAKYP